MHPHYLHFRPKLEPPLRAELARCSPQNVTQVVVQLFFPPCFFIQMCGMNDRDRVATIAQAVCIFKDNLISAHRNAGGARQNKSDFHVKTESSSLLLPQLY